MIQKTLAFVIGVVVLQFQSALPPLLVVGALIPLLCAIGLFRLHSYIQTTLLLFIGFLWAAFHGHMTLSSELDQDLQGIDLIVTGVIASLPDRTSERTRFELKAESMTYQEKSISFPKRLLVSWYKNAPLISAGEKWQFLVRLKRPHGLSNPGGYDYERTLYSRGIRATGYVRVDGDNYRIAPAGNTYIFNRLREDIGHKITQHVNDKSVSGIILALIIGDRSQISSSQWDLFRQTGTNHLMAISGLHIGIVSGLFFFVGQGVWRRFNSGCHMLPAPQFAALTALLAGFVYAGLAGFATPCTRALIMLTVVMGSVLLKRRVQPFQSLATALFVIVVLDPVAVISAGFWLSFGAVFVILLGMQVKRSSRRRLFRDLVRMQWVVSLGLAPILILLGFQVPLISPAVNIFMVPLFSLILVPLLLCAVLLLYVWPFAGASLINLAARLIRQVEMLLSGAAAYNYNLPTLAEAPLWMSMGFLCAVLMFLLPSAIPGRRLALLLALPALFYKPVTLPADAVRVTMLDVGQGLSVVVETAHHVLLYDAGPSFPSGFDTGKRVVIPFLNSRGIQHLDRVIVSNGDSDHRGGLGAVLDQFPGATLMSGEPERIPVGDPTPCAAGQRWTWDGVDFELLHPDNNHHWRGNNATCVVAIRNKSGQILLTGDIESEAEASLVRRYRERLRSLVVTVPHHGSASSSGSAFINMTQPEYGLISAGYLNRYRFPRDQVLQRWQKAQIALFNTAESGAISFIIQPDGTIQGPWSHRISTKRYWMKSSS